MIILNVRNEQEMQLGINRLSSACEKLGVTIATKKTDVLFQPAPINQYHEPQMK